MRVTATWNLRNKEERNWYADAYNGHKWRAVVEEFVQWLRGVRKHGHDYKTADEALDACWEAIWQEQREQGLDVGREE